MIKLITVSDFVYTSGQGGTPYYPNDFSQVVSAQAIIAKPAASDALDVPYVSAVGLASGTINSKPPAPNEILISIYSNTASLTEIASGTIASLNLLVDGL